MILRGGTNVYPADVEAVLWNLQSENARVADDDFPPRLAGNPGLSSRVEYGAGHQPLRIRSSPDRAKLVDNPSAAETSVR